MERLTTTNSMGIAVLKCADQCERCSEPIWRLNDMGNGEPISKLAGYEDAEEQGLLLRLPCKVGDTLYVIDTDEKIDNLEIIPYTIDNIVILNTGEVLFKYDNYDGVICYLENIITDKPYLDYYRVYNP
jgi:hypothetical protein